MDVLRPGFSRELKRLYREAAQAHLAAQDRRARGLVEEALAIEADAARRRKRLAAMWFQLQRLNPGRRLSKRAEVHPATFGAYGTTGKDWRMDFNRKPNWVYAAGLCTLSCNAYMDALWSCAPYKRIEPWKTLRRAPVFPSQQKIADRSGLDIRTVKRCQQEAEEKSMIEVLRPDEPYPIDALVVFEDDLEVVTSIVVENTLARGNAYLLWEVPPRVQVELEEWLASEARQERAIRGETVRRSIALPPQRGRYTVGN